MIIPFNGRVSSRALWCVGTAFELEGATHLPQAAGKIPHALQVSAHYGCFSRRFLRHLASEFAINFVMRCPAP